MNYSRFTELYDALYATTKRLEKAAIVCEFLKELSKEEKPELIYLLQGKVVPEYDVREFGISTQLVMKTLHMSFGVSEAEVQNEYSKVGDFGEIAMRFAEKIKLTEDKKNASTRHATNTAMDIVKMWFCFTYITLQ